MRDSGAKCISKIEENDMEVSLLSSLAPDILRTPEFQLLEPLCPQACFSPDSCSAFELLRWRRSCLWHGGDWSARTWLMLEDSSTFGVSTPPALRQAFGITCFSHASLNNFHRKHRTSGAFLYTLYGTPLGRGADEALARLACLHHFLPFQRAHIHQTIIRQCLISSNLKVVLTLTQISGKKIPLKNKTQTLKII